MTISIVALYRNSNPVDCVLARTDPLSLYSLVNQHGADSYTIMHKDIRKGMYPALLEARKKIGLQRKNANDGKVTIVRKLKCKFDKVENTNRFVEFVLKGDTYQVE